MENIDDILSERGERYGEYVNVALTAQMLKHALRRSNGWNDMAADMKESLEMISNKLARIVNGDCTYLDSWVDVAGYAKLVADRLEKIGR